MPAGEVIASYHDLWHVEASFRMSKSDLKARPIFHHTRDSIEAHLIIVFAALAVARYLQDATGMSIKKIVRTLRPLQQVNVRIAGHDHLAEDPLTPAAEAILDAVEDILGPNLLVWSSSLFIKEAHDPSYISWHQDSTYWGLSHPDVVTAWLALSVSHVAR